MMKDEEQPEPPQEQPVAPEDASVVGEQSSLSYAGILVSSIVLLIAITSNDYIEQAHDHMYKYGISLASIAMILSLLGWIVATKTDDNEKLVVFNNCFLFCWCFVGACFMTFGDNAPFQITGNGYFGSWGLAVFATMALGVNIASMQETAAHNGADGPTLGLFASSVVLLTAISSHGIDNSKSYFGELVYSLILAIVTILMCGGVFVMKKSDNVDAASAKAKVFGMAGFAIMWITAACLVTFRGPFLVTGNGYFGAWGGAVTAVFAVNAARRGQHE